MTPDRLDMLDRYLDDQLTQAERVAFERRLLTNPELRAHVERQSIIDGALSRVLSPPEFDLRVLEAPSAQPSSNGKNHHPVAASVPARLDPERRDRRKLDPRTWSLRNWAMAAGVLLILSLSAALYVATRPGHQPDYPELAWRSPEMVYRIEVQKGMHPLWVCRDDQEFATTFWKTLGQAVVVRDTPDYIANLGLSYSNTFSPKTVVHLARVRETPVIVLIDLASNDTRFAVSPESGLRVHRAQLGNLVLYELSPLAEAHLLKLFETIEMPDAWKPK